MLTHHIPSTTPPEASPEDIILAANHIVDPSFLSNVTTATTHTAVVTQATQNNNNFDGVDLASNGDRHHTPLTQPTNTYPEAPHGPHLPWCNGECLTFSILLHWFFWQPIAIAASPVTASDVLRARMRHVPGYLGLCLFPACNTSYAVAVYFCFFASFSHFYSL